MSTFDNKRLITPPREEEEIYPYRRAWRSFAIEAALIAGASSVIFVAINFIGFRLPDVAATPFNLLVAVLPAGVWSLFSLLAEYRVPEPRTRLLVVFGLSALLANAIGRPLVDEFLQPAQWLSLESAGNRIIGFTVTFGIVQETLKYIVLRLSIWPQHLRTREDSIAYALASAVGYATVLNVAYASSAPALPDANALRVLHITGMSLVGSLILSYGLSETRFGRANPLLLPATLFLAAFVSGVAISVRAGLINASLSLEGAAGRPLFGLGFSILLIIGIPVAIAFLYNVAERRERDLLRSQEID